MWEVQEVRPCALPDKGELVLGEMHGVTPVARAGVCHRQLGL